MKIIAENAQGFEGNPDIALDLLNVVQQVKLMQQSFR